MLKRVALAVDSIAAVVAALASIPDSDAKQRLISDAHACEREVLEWPQQPPSDEQREALMKRVLSLHIQVADLRRRSVPNT
jgi:hypothetical protein